MPTISDCMKNDCQQNRRIRQPIGNAAPTRIGDAGSESKDGGKNPDGLVDHGAGILALSIQQNVVGRSSFVVGKNDARGLPWISADLKIWKSKSATNMHLSWANDQRRTANDELTATSLLARQLRAAVSLGDDLLRVLRQSPRLREEIKRFQDFRIAFSSDLEPLFLAERIHKQFALDVGADPVVILH